MAIDFNYSLAMKQVADVRNIANDMDNAAKQEMSNAINGISANWCGEVARIYLDRCGAVQNDIQNQAKILRDVAAAMEKIAISIKKAEEAAKNALNNK